MERTSTNTAIPQAIREQLRGLLLRGEIVATANRTGLSRDGLERFLAGANAPQALAYFSALTDTVRLRQKAERATARMATNALADLAPPSQPTADTRLLAPAPA